MKQNTRSSVAPQVQSPIITAFLYPEDQAFRFSDMYHFIRERGYAIYPGKITRADTFRIGNIGKSTRRTSGGCWTFSGNTGRGRRHRHEQTDRSGHF